VFQQFFQDWQQVSHQVLGKEVAEEGEGGHDDEGVVGLEVLHYGVVHEQAEVVPGFDEEGGQEVAHLFEVEVGGLAEVDGQDVGEGGVVSKSLEVDELDEDVRVLLGIAAALNLRPYIVDLSRYYLLLS
jgi:hypothetical protein